MTSYFKNYLEKDIDVLGAHSSHIERAVYICDTQAIAVSGNLVWTPTPNWIEGDEQLDFADLANPTVIEAGIYAVTTIVGVDSTPGKVGKAELNLDGAGHDSSILEVFSLDGLGGNSPQVNITMTQYIPVGGSIYIWVSHDDTNPVNFGATIYLQRVT